MPLNSFKSFTFKLKTFFQGAFGWQGGAAPTAPTTTPPITVSYDFDPGITVSHNFDPDITVTVNF